MFTENIHAHYLHVHRGLKLICRIIEPSDLSSCGKLSCEMLRVRFGVCVYLFWLLDFLRLHERYSCRNVPELFPDIPVMLHVAY